MSGKGQRVPGPETILDARLLSFDEPCPYLKDRTATLQGFFSSRVPPEFYRRLMDLGFRRSGRFFYHNACAGCAECVPIRVLIKDFAPSRSQRRCWKHNQDLVISIGPPELTEERYELYCEYVRGKHGDSSEKDVGAVSDFLYNPVVDSVEFSYRNPQGRLLAVGICDVFQDALSSVYCYYDPAERRRGLGTFTALKEIEYARRQSMAYYYLGFLVSGCQAMRYKATYRPHELLDLGRGWVA